jgi:hypothetical protein
VIHTASYSKGTWDISQGIRRPTEVMVCSKDFENINIKMDDYALKQVSQFKYNYRRWEK